MNSKFKKISDWYFKYERHLTSLGIIGGFLFDIFTLTRIDHALENFWIGLHLIVAAVGILFLNLYEEGKLKEKIEGRAHFWWTFVIQFAFGGLFSVYLVFYARSSSFFASWPFLLILLLNFIANERLRQRYKRIGFQMSMLFLALLFYNIYIIPILVKEISPKVFLLSGIISLILMGIFILVLLFLTPKRIGQEKYILISAISGIYLLINILYFTDLIPPIPLSLKEANVYHSVTRNNGRYNVLEEAGQIRKWYQYFLDYQTIHLTEGEPAYVYSAVFAPTLFSTEIIHRWQYYDSQSNKWLTANIIPLSIIGGRDGGFRTYSQKSVLSPGFWRVQVETPTGQLIGSLKFEIVRVLSEPSLTMDIR